MKYIAVKNRKDSLAVTVEFEAIDEETAQEIAVAYGFDFAVLSQPADLLLQNQSA